MKAILLFLEKMIRFPSNGKNFQTFNDVKLIDGEWSVSFDPKRGGPENIIFESLVDWKDHTEPGVKHYSGKATYTKTFDNKQK